jgi:hypothetical protein
VGSDRCPLLLDDGTKLDQPKRGFRFETTWLSHKDFKNHLIETWPQRSESASRPLVDFSVLNDNLIKGLISCVMCITRFLVKVQMYSLIHHLKYNYEANKTM